MKKSLSNHAMRWSEVKRPIICLAPMDGVTNSAYRQIVRSLNRDVLLFSEFTSVNGLTKGDYWEFDCCAPYVSGLLDEEGKLIPPTEKNFLGQFGRVFPKDELRDSGFEVMMRHPNTYVLDSQKFSYFFINEQNSYWELTDNLRLQGSLCLNTKFKEITTSSQKGELIYRDDYDTCTLFKTKKGEILASQSHIIIFASNYDIINLSCINHSQHFL